MDGTNAKDVAAEMGYECRLPGGARIGGMVHRDIVITEMTGEDEENISRPEVAGNGGKAITVLLANCVKKLGTIPVTQDLIQNLLIGDRDFLMIKLRILSIGDDYTIDVVCPSCKSKFGIAINMNDLVVKEMPDNAPTKYPFTLKKGYKDSDGHIHTKGSMGLPTGVEQEYLSTESAARNPGVAATQLLTRCCVELGTLRVINTDVVRKLSSTDRNIMADILTKNMPGPDLSASVDCPSCKNEWIHALQASSFFARK